jgi:hypothetical protein
MDDAETRYLERIAADCEQLLGAGVDLSGLEIETNGETVLRARYRLGPANAVSEGRGESLLAAHTELRRRLVEDRLGLGFRALSPS